MSESKPLPSLDAPVRYVTVQWDTKQTKVPAVNARAVDVLLWNPWGEMFDRELNVNGEPVDYDQPLTLCDGDRILSVPKGYY